MRMFHIRNETRFDEKKNTIQVFQNYFLPDHSIQMFDN